MRLIKIAGLVLVLSSFLPGLLSAAERETSRITSVAAYHDDGWYRDGDDYGYRRDRDDRRWGRHHRRDRDDDDRYYYRHHDRDDDDWDRR
jgi:hypothetical protein